MILGITAYILHVLVSVIVAWRLAVSKRLPRAATVYGVLMIVGMVNDSISLMGAILKLNTYAYLRGHVYTIIELWLFASFAVLLLNRVAVRKGIVLSAIVMTIASGWFHLQGWDAWTQFDSYSSGIVALSLIAFSYCVLWEKTQEIVRDKSKQWIALLTLVVICAALMDFLIFFSVQALHLEEGSIWFLHHIASIVKYSFSSYCYWRKL